VDTNVIIRHLVQDHERHARAAAKLFAACDRGQVTLVILPAVLAECVFILDSFYQHPRGHIARVLRSLVRSPGIELAELALYLDALGRYGRTKVHFVDCVIAATAAAHSWSVATFDADFRKFSDVTVNLS
jgi:predicted nucleic acid-binding protein